MIACFSPINSTLENLPRLADVAAAYILGNQGVDYSMTAAAQSAAGSALRARTIVGTTAPMKWWRR